MSNKLVMGHVSFGPPLTPLDVDIRNGRGQVGKPGSIDIRQGGMLPPGAVGCELDVREVMKPLQTNEASSDVLGSVLAREWQQSRHNKTAIMESQLAGCFHCIALVAPSAITEWVDEDGTTAICPACGIDSLIPRMELKNPMLLLQLRKRYFDE